MKTEDIFRILNNGKRLAHYEQKEPKKRTLTTILMNYTGKSIKKKVSEALETLKNDLTIVFKPVKRFTKKQLQPADTTTLYSNDNIGNKEVPMKSVGNKEVPTKKDEFINWFDLGKNDKNSENSENEEKNVKKNNIITLTRADGTKTTLDEDLDRLIF
jgi:hypothetical protein